MFYIHNKSRMYSYLPYNVHTGAVNVQAPSLIHSCGSPPKESVGAPAQMTVSQHSKSEGWHPSPLSPTPSSLYCSLYIKELCLRHKNYQSKLAFRSNHFLLCYVFNRLVTRLRTPSLPTISYYNQLQQSAATIS
jgi:hypothetical protein